MLAERASEFYIPTFAAIALVVCSGSDNVVGAGGVGKYCECFPVPLDYFDVLAASSAIAIVDGDECFFAQKCGAFASVGDVGDLNTVAQDADSDDCFGEG